MMYLKTDMTYIGIEHAILEDKHKEKFLWTYTGSFPRKQKALHVFSVSEPQIVRYV